MADFPDIPEGKAIPLVDTTTRLFPAPTMDALDERYEVDVPVSQVTRAGMTVAIGDSIEQGAVGGSGSGSWVSYLSVLSNARLRLLRNAGIGGNTTAQILARLQADAIEYGPEFVLIGGGTNDQSQGVPEATTRANILAIVAAVREAGMTPMLRTVPPSDVSGLGDFDTVEKRRNGIERINLWLTFLAATEGIPLFDIYASLVDEDNGGFRSGYTADGSHPTAEANAITAQAIVDAGLPTILPGPPALPLVKNQSGYLTSWGDPDPLFTNPADGDGVSAGWAKQGVSTTTVVADASIPGNWQRVVTTDPAAGILSETNVTITAGNFYAFVARVKCTSGGFRLRAAVWGAGGTVDMDLTEPVEGLVYVEVEPTAGVTALRNMLTSSEYGSGSTDIQFAQAGIVDLTALGVA